MIVNSDPENAHLNVFYDIAELSLVHGEDATQQCRRGNETRWLFVAEEPDYPSPYFMGCKRDIRYLFIQVKGTLATFQYLEYNLRGPCP